MKRLLVFVLSIAVIVCSLSACSANSEKRILGEWYNEKGDCLRILSDNTYSIDNIYNGYEIGIDSGEWVYLEEENYYKFYADNYDESIIKVEIEKDEKGTYIKYTYYGTFYKE